MEIEIKEDALLLSDYLSRTKDLILAAPVKFYSHDPEKLVKCVKKDNKITVYKRNLNGVSDKEILDVAKELEEVKVNHFIFDIIKKWAIYDLDAKRILNGFNYFPMIDASVRTVLIETEFGELKKTYDSTGNTSILWAVRATRLFHYRDKLTPSLHGMLTYFRMMPTFYGLLEPSFMAVYERELQGIENILDEKNRILAKDTTELNRELAKTFIEDIEEHCLKEDDYELTLTYILEKGIPVTEELEKIELDMAIDGIIGVDIKNGELYIKADTKKIETTALDAMFGDDYHLIPLDLDEILDSDDDDEFYEGYRMGIG